MKKRIIKNYIYSAGYRILITIIPLITTPYISRVLHAEGVGIYGYTNSLASAFALFAALGFASYGQREVAYNQDDIHQRSIIFYEIIILRAITTSVCVAAFLVFSFIYREYTYYLLPYVMLIISVAADIAWYYQGLENFRITVLKSLIVRLLSVVFIFCFVKKETDTWLYIFLLSFSTLISNLFYLINIRKYIEKINTSELHPLRHIKGSIEFFIPLIAVEIYSHLDRIMLGYLTTSTESGYYEQARKLTAVIVGVVVSINNVMMSRISFLYANNKDESIINYYRKSFKIIMMMVFPIIVGLMIISDNFTLWFYGEGYEKVASLLKLSGILIIFMSIGNFVGVQFLGPTGKVNKGTQAYLIAALVNIILNAVMIPRYLSIGAMLASIVAEIISCGLQVYFLYRSTYQFNMSEGIWIYIVSALIMGGLLLSIRLFSSVTGILGTLIDVFVGGTVYFLSLLLLKEENAMSILIRIKRRIQS